MSNRRSRPGTGGIVLRGRMLAVLILALVLAAGLLGMLPPTAARAADGDGIQVLITKMTPVAKAGGSITIEGRVLNTGTRAIDSMEVAVRVRTSEPLFRSGISSPEDAQSNGTLLRDSKPVVLHNLDPGAGAAQPWTFTFPADTLGLGVAGAYPLGIEARIGGRTAGAARTFLPWIPRNGLKNVQNLRVATVWPLVDRPHRDGTTLGDEGQTPVFRDDDLAAQFAPGGRLYDLVNIGTGMKVDWAIDPELLDSAAEMAGGYRVAPPGSLDPDKPRKSRNGKAPSDEDTAKATPNQTTNTLAGGGGQVATGWLDRLKTGIGTQPVIALPYADTDLAAVAHALEAGKADLRPQLSEALAESATVMQRTLARPVRTDVAWPAGGALDPSIVRLANGTGASTVIASGASLPPTKELKVTPSATAALPGTDKGTALVTDPDIDRILAADTKAPGQSVLTTQQLLAELLTIVLQEPSASRSLLIAPPRTMDASLANVLKDVLNASADWTRSATLANLAAEPAPLPARKLAGYPKAVSASEPSMQYLTETDNLVRSMQSFASILTRPERVTGPFNPALLRLLSTEWRGDPQGMDRYRLGVTRSLRELQSLVYIIRRTGVTLSGDEGNIPVTVVNNLQQPVIVRIAADSHQPNRLKLGDPITVTVPDGRRREVPISAKSAANGKVMVDVRLLTPDGRAVRPPESFFVNTTTIDVLTRWIIGGLAFLLAVFSLRAFLRKRREAALAGDTNDEDGEDGDDTPSDNDPSEEVGPDPIRPASGWPPAHSAAPYAGGNGPPDPADPHGHTPSGSTPDRPE
ncbi:DUF6049 family protein [Embleya sp. NPDC005575]|uniref:DUF6049 family protein n=1 Tax=Embleya sp. NPDC005575 TaxID=3156892 RepID=UPI0033A35E0F